jgi:hypothetical protein
MPAARFQSTACRKQIYKITYPNGKIYVGMAISTPLDLTDWAYYGHETYIARLGILIELGKRLCAILGLK